MTNVLVIPGDDGRFEHYNYMPRTRARFAHGSHFTWFRQNVPICNAHRTGFLSGQYALHSGAWSHDPAHRDLADYGDTIGPWMQDAGYFTGFIGKGLIGRSQTPDPGWDFRRTFTAATEQSAYGCVIYNGTTTLPASDTYTTELCAELFAEFLTAAGSDPWFCWLTPSSPHIDDAPSFKSQPRFGDLRAWEWVDWPQVDYSDHMATKPSWMQALPEINQFQRKEIRQGAINQLRELVGLDEMVDDVLDMIDLTDTVVMFTFDNGVFYGEQNVWDSFPSTKKAFYECCLHDPLVIIGPGFDGGGEITVPTVNMDLTATVAAIGGATPGHALDGVDLREIVANPERYRRRGTLHELDTHNVPVTDMPAGKAIVTATRKLCRWDASGGNKYEMYDLDTDPGELVNVANDPDRLGERNELEARLDDLISL